DQSAAFTATSRSLVIRGAMYALLAAAPISACGTPDRSSSTRSHQSTGSLLASSAPRSLPAPEGRNLSARSTARRRPQRATSPRLNATGPRGPLRGNRSGTPRLRRTRAAWRHAPLQKRGGRPIAPVRRARPHAAQRVGRVYTGTTTFSL